jgi:hypothetical protein
MFCFCAGDAGIMDGREGSTGRRGQSQTSFQMFIKVFFLSMTRRAFKARGAARAGVHFVHLQSSQIRF